MANNQQLLLGEGAGGGIPNYIEEVFSTYLYDGTGATQTITNNIDLSTKGGLVWIKNRATTSGFTFNHFLFDTTRGALNRLITNNTDSSQGTTGTLTSFNTNGFSLGADSGGNVNYGTGTNTYASWTFREQPKFFDVVTYTGDGTSSQTINHNLGASPGCIITKRTDSTGNWTTWHRSFADTKTYIYLNTTAASVNVPSADAMTVSSTSFTVGTNQVFGNGSGFVYVAYLFAHDAGGFGLAGTDNVISCGSVTADGSGNLSVNLGYEPQWLMIKASSSTSNWWMRDIMRGMTVSEGGTNYGQALYANLSDAESNTSYYINPNATGFTGTGWVSGVTYIYIAIRRGPMKVPTVGTSVFAPFASSGATGTQLTTNFPVDSGWFDFRGGDSNNASVLDRLRGVPSTSTDTAANRFLKTSATAAEATTTVNGYEWWNTGIRIGPYYATYSTVYWLFGRAPGFFDEVCYTGTGSNTTQTHNLGAVPELMIVKRRSTAESWFVYAAALGNTKYTLLNYNLGVYTDSTFWNSTTPTVSVFTLGTNTAVNNSGSTYVAYLFATCAGVSKVGSYTGNGSSQTIACGFTAGSRFVMIKRTDSTGDWYVWDSARGIVAGNDPHLSLNDGAAEVTTDDSVDTDNSGFIVNQVAATNVNVSSATYIFLAIA